MCKGTEPHVYTGSCVHTHPHTCTRMHRHVQVCTGSPKSPSPVPPSLPRSPRAQPLARCSAQGAPAAPPHCSRAVLCGGTRGHAARHPHQPRAEPDAREHPPSGGMKPRAAPPASQPRLAAAAAASPPARSGRCSGSWHPWAALPLNNLPQQPPLSPRRALLLRQIIPRAGVYTHIRSTPPAPPSKAPPGFPGRPPSRNVTRPARRAPGHSEPRPLLPPASPVFAGRPPAGSPPAAD